ncbi:fumarylacetoacetate hydrolase family protein [Pseudomonas jinjuensis]|uniref:2-keto-4-pentenoate hydratase/2-oxohepta-3-ene-1,7-dioic acid hydratase (Catechol pathway) n=1 Tax=Pseudomonas jinjuensis TaxID=198616 RepID=A0A1H0CT40_9PSED|nr:fumarylacetoacetate hydrolase family protein [Pseudomonas jinjuensis]SDN61048.1 2-keto-4-pentenoate hydratase/2-oxohepta-3-ene-1,7-dioic acid hydratase (catechol pathway) [Pseudomonas jinjuensis]
MKICRFNDNRIGIVRDDMVHDITPLFASLGEPGWPYPSYDWIIGNFPRVRDQIEPYLARAATLPLSAVTLRAPVANPGKIIGAPINYRDHIDEANADQQIAHGKTFTTLDQYGLFLKATTALTGPDGTVEIPFPERRTDHEIELGVIIGRKARRVPRERALEYVFGYCVALDMTVRGPEFPGFRKSADTFAVIGPWITSADEIADPNNLDFELSVNGEVRQKSNTQYLIFNVQRLIEYASAMYTLQPGDIIMTGTPAGVGPVQPGDVMHARVSGLGELTMRMAQP